MDGGRRLDHTFFCRDAAEVARDLLGCVLRNVSEDGAASGIIVETEAYLGSGDDACHARFGITPRTRVMFGPPGHAYVYFVYGMHSLFNVVTGSEGEAGAVLVRALEPVEGVELMRARRGLEEEKGLTSGPGKLTRALGIDLAHNGCDLSRGGLGMWRVAGMEPVAIREGVRIGISGSKELDLRFHVEGSRFVSKALR